MSENVILDFKKLKLSPKEISFSYSSLVRHAIYYIELCLYRLSYKLYKKYSYGRLCPFMCPYDHDNIHEHIFWALKSRVSTTQNHVYYPEKKVTLSIFNIQCEERYKM